MTEENILTPEESAPVTTAIPLLAPANGIPPVVDTDAKFAAAIQELTKGNGPFAVDAERAS